MLFLILSTFGICLSLLTWILLSLVCVSLLRKYKDDKKCTFLLLPAVSVLWITISYNTWFQGFFILQETILLPSLNSWIPTLIIPLFFLYHKYHLTGGFPDEMGWFWHLLTPGALVVFYTIATWVSPVPDKLIYSWHEFISLFPSWWMVFRVVCCLSIAVQLWVYLSALRKMDDISGAKAGLFSLLLRKKGAIMVCLCIVLLMNVLTSIYACIILGNMLFAVLGIYVFRQPLIHRTIKDKFAGKMLSDKKLYYGEHPPVEEAEECSGPNLSAEEIARVQQLLNSPGYLHNRNICIKLLARDAAVNVTYLSRYFNQDLKMSFPEFITTLRLSEAEVLLRETAMRVADVCEEVGFQSLATFYQAFNARFRMTPSQWRKKKQDELAEARRNLSK